ncbi:MAG: hypothetical protein FH749_02095 [Firmicutes bacterium]|nr:hypothetical protein [Bacillota bacterium]
MANAKTNVIYSFSAEHKPVAEIASGETLVVETADCFNGQVHSEEQDLAKVDFSRGNPATGPFYINNANPGDGLQIEILEIKLAERGVIIVAPGQGVLEDITEPKVRVLELAGNFARFTENITIPVRPMVGVIGIAPAEGSVDTTCPGKHGGNLDCKELSPGNKIILPVAHSGGLLALGDVHAAMGDGELAGCALEAGAEVKLRIDILPGQAPEHPRIVTEKGTIILASASSTDAALREAAREAVLLLAEEHSLSYAEAYMLAGSVCDLGLSQVVNPLKTAKIFVPRLV